MQQFLPEQNHKKMKICTSDLRQLDKYVHDLRVWVVHFGNKSNVLVSYPHYQIEQHYMASTEMGGTLQWIGRSTRTYDVIQTMIVSAWLTDAAAAPGNSMSVIKCVCGEKILPTNKAIWSVVEAIPKAKKKL